MRGKGGGGKTLWALKNVSEKKRGLVIPFCILSEKEKEKKTLCWGEIEKVVNVCVCGGWQDLRVRQKRDKWINYHRARLAEA